MRRPDLRILYVTGDDCPSHEAMGKILRKPIGVEALLDEVRDALQVL
jgi:hypothetical protein